MVMGLFGQELPDEVPLAVLSHIEDPWDLLRVGQTCHRALRLSRDKTLWEVVLRRSPHERAARWCSLVLDGIPPHLALAAALARSRTGGDDGDDDGDERGRMEVSIVAWLRFFARHKRALVACLRPHCVSDEMATALAEVLMSRELMKDWHLNPTIAHDQSLGGALGRLPPQFVYHLLIFPIMEEHLESFLAKEDVGKFAASNFTRWSSLSTMLPTVWLHGRLKATLQEKFVPLIESDLFSSGEMELEPRRAVDEESVTHNQARLQRACDAMVEAVVSLDFPIEPRLIWSQMGSSIRRVHLAHHHQQQQGSVSREASTGMPSARQTSEAEHDDEDHACLQALGTVIIFRTGFSVLNTRQMGERLSKQQKRNLLLTAKAIQLLLHRLPISAKEPWWECMHEWIRVNRHRIDDMLRRASTVTDEEMIELLRDAVYPEDDTQGAHASHFDGGHAAKLEKHLRSYALACIKAEEHRLRSSWLLKRLHYLFASVTLTIRVTVIGGRSFEHAELRPKENERPLAMARRTTANDEGEWQCEVTLPTGLAYTDEPISITTTTTAVTSSTSHEEETACTRGFAFRFGLFRRKPEADCDRRADLPVVMSVATVPTRTIVSGLPHGSVELVVPLVVTTTHRLYARGEDEDTADDAAKPAADTAADDDAKPAAAECPRGGAKKSEEKRGWLRGLVSRLQRAGGKAKDEDENEVEDKNEVEKEQEGEDEEEAEMGTIVGQLRVLITIASSSYDDA